MTTMPKQALPERFFIGSIQLAFLALVLATVGIKSHIMENAQFLILLLSLLLVIWMGLKTGRLTILTNRLRKYAIGWIIAALTSAMVWFCLLYTSPSPRD